MWQNIRRRDNFIPNKSQEHFAERKNISYEKFGMLLSQNLSVMLQDNSDIMKFLGMVNIR